MTISYLQSTWAEKPFIRIANKYLEKYGFHVGDRIEVEYQPDQITIRPLKNDDN